MDFEHIKRELLRTDRTEEETKRLMQAIEQNRDKMKSQADINMLGQQWEKEGRTAEAAVLYEMNLLDNFDGSFPYDRLAVIYKKQKKYDDLVRVLEKAVYVFENIVHKDRADRQKKLDKYKEKLEKAIGLL